MAIQEWIAMRKELPGDPAVLRIMEKLKWDRPEIVVGYLHRVWSWFDDHCVDGIVKGVTLDALEAHLAMPHFLHLMCEVGWLEYMETPSETTIMVPHWDRWMASTAKKRLKNARRAEDYRARTNVRTDAHAKRSSSSSSSSSPSKPKKSSVFQKPTEEDAASYFDEKGFTSDPMAFFDFYESNGWRVGRNPMKDWRRAANNWEKRQSEFGAGQTKEQRALEEKRRHMAAENARIEAEERRRQLSRQGARSGLEASESLNAALNEIERGL